MPNGTHRVMPDGADLDGTAIRTEHRIEHGYPAVYQPHMFYGFEVQGDVLVSVPLRLRTRKFAGFSGLSVT